MDLNNLKGIGEKTEKLFYKAGVEKVNDLLRYYPRYYDVFEEPVLIRDLECDRTQAIKGTVVREVSVKRVRNLQVVTGYLRDERGDAIKATWFNSPYLKGKLTIGSTFIFRGFVKENYSNFSIEQPKIFGIAEYNKKKGEMQPVYPLVSGLTNNMVQKAVKQALKLVETEEFLPEKIRNKYGLEGLQQAIEHIHYPTDKNQLYSARKRLIFDEFFMFIYNIRNLKDKNTEIHNRHILEEPKEVKTLINNLPYELTNAQKRTWEEIKRDISSTKVMNRLIQGDVGSGKTIVAFLSMYQAALCHYQSALMAPTEVLASQHYQGFTELSERYHLNLSIVLLTGSMRAGQKKEALRQIREHEADIVIGTHAVIQEKVEFDDLALVITDEQHRFGVAQRDALSKKGHTPHVLVMSATPIPRSLAMILYGDLDISIMDELPAKRLPIKNCVVNISYRPKAWDFIIKQVQAGHQAYVICPMVEESETSQGADVVSYTEQLREALPSYISIEYLHGKMKAKEKDDIMAHFAKNETQVLVSTTVIEVGINVPNATVILIEDAQRFGLAQLHQLRGRVGRGDAQSYCIMIDTSGKEESAKRLEVLNHSNDGFAIANEDLKLRGPGDFFGIRQSGEIAFAVADIYQDAQLLKWAKEAADSAQVMAEVETHSI